MWRSRARCCSRRRERLLRETEQRAGELAVINSIQQGISAELEFQAIIDLVGDKLRAVLARDDITIVLFDEVTGLLNYAYAFENGERLYLPATASDAGRHLRDAFDVRRQPQRVDTRREVEDIGGFTFPGTAPTRCRCSMCRSSPTIVSSA